MYAQSKLADATAIVLVSSSLATYAADARLIIKLIVGVLTIIALIVSICYTIAKWRRLKWLYRER